MSTKNKRKNDNILFRTLFALMLTLSDKKYGRGEKCMHEYKNINNYKEYTNYFLE